MVDRERQGSDRRDERRHDDGAAIAEDLPQQRPPVQQPREPRAKGFVDGDQRDDRAKRHLKADADEAHRVDRQHRRRGDGADPHRDPQPVDEDRDKDEAVHDKGALRRDRGAGDQQIAGQDGEGGRRRDLLDRGGKPNKLLL